MISIIIIGNEILSASVQDKNLAYMLGKLAAGSYPVDEVRIIRDDIPTIAETIRALSARSKIVISSGGVGPTHDDVTLEAYAAAYEQEMILHPRLEEMIRRYFGDDVKESALRMARVPANTELVDVGPKNWPLIKVDNCYVLPGLPEVFVPKFDHLLGTLPEVPAHYYGEVYTRMDESSFAGFLTDLQTRFPEVEIGSYPTWDRSEYSARVTFRGHHQEQVNAAHVAMSSHFKDADALVHVKEPHRVV